MSSNDLFSMTQFWLGLVLAGAGVLGALWAARSLGVARFFGRPAQGPAFIVRGPYRFVRHPFYSSVLLFLVGCVLCSGRVWVLLLLGVAAVATGLLITAEERRLRQRFGDAYHRFCTAVPALFPLPRGSRRP